MHRLAPLLAGTGDAGFEQLCVHLLTRLEEAAERAAETPEQKLLVRGCTESPEIGQCGQCRKLLVRV